MITEVPGWEGLFQDQRHALLGQLARSKACADVRSLADDEIQLAGEANEATRRPGKLPGSPRLVALTAEKDESLERFRDRLAELRTQHPAAELAGFGPLEVPPSERFRGLDRGEILIGKLGSQLQEAPDVALACDLKTPLTAVLLYAPEVTPESLKQVGATLRKLSSLVGVVPLPASAGDRIPLAGLTTAGNTDAMVISVLRLLLPSQVRVRASWAALGWKVAQVTLAYGADEIAGWTSAESLAYTGRVRAACRVEREELNQGLAEARRRDLGWSNPSSGGAR
jgi:hypothetical protein